MAKSLLYAVNDNTQTLAAGDTLFPGAIIRKYGQCISLMGNTITLNSPGYYDIDVTATFAGAAAGDVGFTVLMNGVKIPGATIFETITTPTTNLRSVDISTVTKVCCPCGATITIIIDTASTAGAIVSDLAVRVEKI